MSEYETSFSFSETTFDPHWLKIQLSMVHIQFSKFPLTDILVVEEEQSSGDT